MKTFSFFLRRERTCFAVVWTTWAYDDKCSVLSSYVPRAARFQVNSRIVRIHFSSIMTSNNWKMIAETRSYIFKWRSRFRGRRVCLSSLLNSLWHFMNIQTNINRKHFAKLQVVGQQSTANCRLSIYRHCSYWIFDECRIIYLFEQKSSWLNHFYGPRRILWLVGLPCQQYRFQTGLFNRLDIGIGSTEASALALLINIWSCHIMFRFPCLFIMVGVAKVCIN